MLSRCAGMDRAMATAPMTNAAMRATLTSSCSETGSSFLMTP
jgi:hypothetical protein